MEVREIRTEREGDYHTLIRVAVRTAHDLFAELSRRLRATRQKARAARRLGFEIT